MDQNCWISNFALSAAPGYWDQCGVHAAVDADHCHVHHLQVVGHKNMQYILRNFLKYTGYFLFTKSTGLQGTFYSQKVVKSVLEPTIYGNLLGVKSRSCASTL